MRHSALHSRQATGGGNLGDTGYDHWLASPETIVAAKGAGSPDELERHRKTRDHAVGRTPHGGPIDLPT